MNALIIAIRGAPRLLRITADPCRGTTAAVENQLQQDLKPQAPNRCWAGDINYIRTKSDWLYVEGWIDLFSRRVVGWKLETRMGAALVIEDLGRALGHRKVEPDQLLIHTDQGRQ